MSRLGIQHHYLILTAKMVAGYKVSYSVAYRKDNRRFLLSEALSKDIIRNGLMWLTQEVAEYTPFTDEINGELQKEYSSFNANLLFDDWVGCDITSPQRFSLN